MQADPTLVFEPSVDPDDALNRTAAALAQAGATEGSGSFKKVFERTPSPEIEVHRWVHDGDGTVVDLTFNSQIPAIFASVLSPKGVDPMPWWRALGSLLDTPDSEDFVENAKESMHPTLIVLAALSSWSGPQPGLEAVVKKALESKDHELLVAGVQAAALLTWPTFAETLRGLSKRADVDASVQDMARVALSKCR